MIAVDAGTIAPFSSFSSHPYRLCRRQTYGAAWVKSKGRQGAGSNQETKEIDTAGRLFLDLVDTTAKALPKLRSTALTEIAAAILSGDHDSGGGDHVASSPWLSGARLEELWRADGHAGRGRLLRYSAGRAGTARACLAKLKTIIEYVSLARVTGYECAHPWISSSGRFGAD